MKRIKIFTIVACIMLMSNLSYGQFLGSGTSAYTGNVYHTGGNVGIGITSPLKDLHIKKTTANSTLRLETVIGSKFGTYYGWDVENTGAYLKFNYGSGSNGSFSTSERISFHSNGIINATSIYLKENPYALKVLLNDGKYLRLCSLSDYQFKIFNGSSTIDALTIDENNGNVGVGNDDPLAPFHVTGNSYFDGKIGVGTTTPTSELEIINSTGGSWNNPTIRVVKNDLTTSDNAGLGIESGDQNWVFGAISSSSSKGLWIRNNKAGVERNDFCIMDATGNVGIGTTNPGTAKLAVNGKLWAQEIKVALTNPWGDFVFEKEYDLKSLNEVENYINKNKHLPGVPSAKEMEEDGINVGEMNNIMMQKIEELTLYTIEQQKLIESMKKEMKALKNEINK